MQVPVKTKNIASLYVLVAAFVAIGFWFFIKKETLWFFAVPLLLVILYYYVVSLDKVLLMITFFTPVAITVNDPRIGAALSVPTEPLMFGTVIVFLGNLLLLGHYNRRVARHPLSYLIYFSLLWMLVTSVTSHLPVVSFKHLLSRVWFVVPFYFLAVPLFRDKKNIHRFLWLYIVAFSGVILYTLVRHAAHGFDEDSGHWVMSPFYNDHTAYGAALAMYLPVLAGYLFYPGLSFYKKLSVIPFLILYVVAVVFSYTRAAWLSLGVAGIVLLLALLRIRFRWILLGTLTLVVLGFVFYRPVMDRMEKNRQDSSSNMEQHLQSMTNISSDASNLERINRWASALRMFDRRPWLGWGPGTYQFVYAPFQLASERTVISTNLGDRGTAHSEYLGPLSEEGVLGLVSVLALFGFSLFLGFSLYSRSDVREIKLLSLIISLSLLTYFVHGFLNNFLDTDKLSVPVWGFMAILVALDVYHAKRYPGIDS